jgi:predicted NAD/FAD-binding protein
MGEILNMPMHTFVRFCDNHGLLQIFNRPTWRTVKNGGRTYVEKMAAHIADIRMNCAVHALSHEANGQVRLQHTDGSDVFDKVVLACHTDQALQILRQDSSHQHAQQCQLLESVRYQPNHVVLHTDAAVMPRDHRLWAAWNYTSGEGAVMERPVGVTYWINRLQHLPFQSPVLVTLNSAREINPSKVLAEFEYDHPIFDQAAIEAQQHLPAVQGHGNVWLAGAWTRYGFHEDGLRSAIEVAHGMGVQVPWETGWASHSATAANQPIKRPSPSWSPAKA